MRALRNPAARRTVFLTPGAAEHRLGDWAGEVPAPHRTRACRGRVLVVDGLTGSGKSWLARGVLRRAPRARLLAVEEHVPGWTGLVEGARRCGEALSALDAGLGTRVTTWDWEVGEPGPSHDLAPLEGGCLVLEGCGALAAAARPLRHLEVLRVIVTASTPLRLSRLVARDDYAWDVEAWQAQERAVSRTWRSPAGGRRPAWEPGVVVREG